VIIMAFVAIIFIQRGHNKDVYSRIQQWGLLTSTTVIMLAFTFYSYHHLPILDFRPYNEGTHIPSKMEIPEDAPQPEYKTILKYKKEGKIREFTVDSLPDSTWQWVETENIQISKGYTPPIEGFSITTLDGSDITDIVLNEENYTFLLIAYNLKKANQSDLEEIKKLSGLCRNNNQCQFIALTASTESYIQKFKDATGVQFPFYQTDEITLKTIIRSNPGLMLLKEGTILEKWHHNDTPAPREIRLDFLGKDSRKNKKKPRDEQETDEELPS